MKSEQWQDQLVHINVLQNALLQVSIERQFIIQIFSALKINLSPVFKNSQKVLA